MAESNPPAPSEEVAEVPTVTFNIKASNDAKFSVSIATSATVADLKQKLSASEYADIAPERQRLIFSGRVLKDADTIDAVKIKDGHTVHLVKGALSNARQNPTSPSSAAPAANVPTNIAAGTGNNPLAAITGARYAGFHGLPNAASFGADGGMGPGMNPEDMERLFDDPNFVSQMNEMMNSPVFMEMMDQSPMLRGNPALRQMLRNPEFRRMMFTPENMRRNMQLSRAMAGGGSFPAPGATDNNTAAAGSASGAPAATTGQPTAGAANPAPGLLAQNQALASLMEPNADLNQTLRTIMELQRQQQQQPQQPGGGAPAGTGTAAGAPANPEIDPAFLNTLRDLFPGAAPPAGGVGAAGAAAAPPVLGGGMGLDGLGALPWLLGSLPGGPGAGPAAPADNRPPEERYEEQLRLLNDMGFVEFERNIEALRRSGGSVQGAIEYLLSNPM